MFWVSAAVLCALAVVACIVPLWRRVAEVPAGSAEMESLKARLRELEDERAQGRIDAHEAELARAEIARRLFRLEDEMVATRTSKAGARWPLVLTALLVPALAVPLYLAIGRPDLPSAPIAERRDLPALVARAESQLRRDPRDARGWLVLAPIYERLRRLDDAERAFEQALRYGDFSDPRRAALLSELAELKIARGNGRVEPALDALRRAVALDGSNAKARYYLALDVEQRGAPEAALKAWRDLKARFPGASAAWTADIAARVARAEASLAGDARERGQASEAAKARNEMIEGMVAGLAARLADDPDDADGWARLIRSYQVLGREDEAAAALASARAAFPDDPRFATP